MRKRIWAQYNKALVQRGSITCYIDKKIMKRIQKFKAKSTGGRPQEFPDALIELLLVVKIQFSLTYRALEGFAKSIFQKAKGWFKIPTYSTVCKRAKALAKVLSKLSTRRPVTVLIDGSGVKVFGEGEWKRKIHGVGRHRKWLKIHIAIDERSQEIVAEALTDCHVGDASMMESLLSAAPKTVKVVKADGAYDRTCARTAIRRARAKALIPPPRNARIKGEDRERDDAVLAIRGLGGDRRARSIWGKLTGYNYRVLVETAFSRYKRLFGDRLFSQTIERQVVENRLKCVMLNKMLRAA